MATGRHWWRASPSDRTKNKCRLLHRILVLGVLLSCSPLVTGDVTTEGVPQAGTSGSTQENDAYREDENASTPWPPDNARPITTYPTVTKAPSTRHDVITTPSAADDVTVAPTEYDVMKSKTFQVTLGVCMSLCGLLVVLLILMMIYTKYRGWKDRMNVAPTVRTGGQIGTDRQELMT